MKNAGNTLSVFLVDDDPLFVTAIKHKLREKFKSGIRVSTFLNGESCLQHMDDKPDLVFLDYYLHPGSEEHMNGLDVLKKIKDISDETEVVMLSSNRAKEIITDTINNGARKYITKGEGTNQQVQAAVNLIIHETVQERMLSENRKLNFIMAGVMVVLGLAILFIYLRYFSS
ncbi:MAG TPA: response regulator [Bacteroidia bacterium]|jgi:DNA-binding NarL/FixJ family response regulator|nr:response regulator [Bacteroidia bacterium]